jgi:hypothetical protein
MGLFDGLDMAARSSIQGAITILLIFIAFGMMLGGPRGAKWVIRTAFAPVKALLEKKITAIIYICVFTILSYYVGNMLKLPFSK